MGKSKNQKYERSFVESIQNISKDFKLGNDFKNFFKTFIEINDDGNIKTLKSYEEDESDSLMTDEKFIKLLTNTNRVGYFQKVPPALWSLMFVTAYDFFEIDFILTHETKSDTKNLRRLYCQFVKVMKEKHLENIKFEVSNERLPIIENDFINIIKNENTIKEDLEKYIRDAIENNRVLDFTNLGVHTEKIKLRPISLAAIFKAFHTVRFTAQDIDFENISEEEKKKYKGDATEGFRLFQYHTKFEESEIAMMLVLLELTPISLDHISFALDRLAVDNSAKAKISIFKKKFIWYIDNILVPSLPKSYTITPVRKGMSIRQIMKIMKIILNVKSKTKLNTHSFLTELLYIIESVKIETKVTISINKKAVRIPFNSVLKKPLERMKRVKYANNLHKNKMMVEITSDNILM